MRIDKFLSNTLEYSRSEIKNYIKKGKVSVNSEVIKDSGFNVKDDDEVMFNGKIVNYTKYRYFILNKPQGVVSATKDNFDKTVIDLLDEKTQKINLFPVGRLDKDTEGLLILTNDGEFAHNSLSPKKHVDKTYFVEVEGCLRDSDVKAFFEGITIDSETLLKSAKLEIIKADEISHCYVTISEGKFHQVKKMFRAVDKTVLYLKRVSFGGYKLPEDVAIGEYRELREDELAVLFGDINE